VRAVARLARMTRDLGDVFRVAPVVERLRREQGAGLALGALRLNAPRRRRRTAAGREDLRRIIQVFDRIGAGRPNCFRRVLIEVALDEGAAQETICFGLRAGLTEESGHVWFASMAPPRDHAYDAQFSLRPP